MFGDKLREQVEERLSFYETGSLPRKNVDVMKEAVQEVRNQRCDLYAAGQGHRTGLPFNCLVSTWNHWIKFQGVFSVC